MKSEKDTWLFVPAIEKYAKKISELQADVLILDLEDSLTLSQKQEGLQIVANILQEYESRNTIYVRVNKTEQMAEELEALSPYHFTGYMIPKFEQAGEMEGFQNLLQGKEIIALVESIKGVVNLEQIAADPLVNKLAFGGEDYCKELGLQAGREATVYARNKMVLYAAYYQKDALDTISFETKDMDAFLKEYILSRNMGFTSKLLIHPAQVEKVALYESSINREYLHNIVKTFQKSGQGVVRIDGKWYEKPHIEKIISYLNETEG
ncbi:MAG TPA: CoA ester lyase [Lachnospiraceae bacterium]|nr:CoA ester lyase [Lachnospiraceae bacterium]